MYDNYKAIHEKIKNICDFIKANNYLKVREEVLTLKNKIEKLDITNWQDYNYELFEKEKINCLSVLNIIINSIDTLYRYSENIYKELLISLNNLEINYTEEEREKIDLYLNILKQINESEVNIKNASLNTKIDLESIKLPVNLATSENENTDTLEFDGKKYVIIKTNNGYQNVLKKIGKQNPDGCLNYSIKYSNEIFNDSNSNKISGYQIIGSSDENEIFKVMANEVLDGRPCIIRVTGMPKRDGYTRHFIAVTGIREGADLDNLVPTDFLTMDPANASLRVLDSSREYIYANTLLKTEEDINWRGHGSNGYLCLVFNNASNYINNNSNLYRGSF